MPSIPLITASILSKKLAESLDALVLDVKFGCAAFMQTKADARKLARAMVALGNACGVNTRALLTDMNTPLGRAAGNWLEVKESVAVLETPTRRDAYLSPRPRGVRGAPTICTHSSSIAPRICSFKPKNPNPSPPRANRRKIA